MYCSLTNVLERVIVIRHNGIISLSGVSDVLRRAKDMTIATVQYSHCNAMKQNGLMMQSIEDDVQ